MLPGDDRRPAGRQGHRAAPAASERIAAGVTAAGHDVSDLTVAEAAAKLQGVYGEHLERGAVTVQVRNLTWRLAADHAGVRFDALRSAERSLEAGRVAWGAPAPR